MIQSGAENMRIGCLQFAPEVGKVSQNIARADAILSKVERGQLDFLILPELAFSGYNFESLEAIKPFLEPSQAGPSTEWAKKTAIRLNCIVSVGYPEIETSIESTVTITSNYNAVVTVSASGDILTHYRKTFLYYTDDNWAKEGPSGFSTFYMSRPIDAKVATGICMDINPYKFESPWTAYEFANHMIHTEASIAALSMAWLIHPNEKDNFDQSDMNAPDINTLQYWVARFQPLINNSQNKEMFLVMANRCGVEGAACYAGSSTVMAIKDGEIRLWGILGKGEERCLIADTSQPAAFILCPRKSSEEEEEE